MSNVIDAILNALQPYYMKILIVFVLIVFSVAGYYGYQKYAVPALTKDITKDIANAVRPGNSADLYFFHADWCPHCRKAKPLWDAATGMEPNNDSSVKMVNGVTVRCHDIDCTNPDDDKKTLYNNMTAAEYIAKYNIVGYPTVKLILGDGTIVEFDSKIDQDSLSNFLDTVL